MLLLFVKGEGVESKVMTKLMIKLEEDKNAESRFCLVYQLLEAFHYRDLISASLLSTKRVEELGREEVRGVCVLLSRKISVFKFHSWFLLLESLQSVPEKSSYEVSKEHPTTTFLVTRQHGLNTTPRRTQGRYDSVKSSQLFTTPRRR